MIGLLPARGRIAVSLAAAALAMLGLGVLVGAAPASAGTPPPGLSVTISDGGAKVATGGNVTYTARLVNAGAKPVAATLVVTVPSYASLAKVKAGSVAGTSASWPVTVAPGKSETVRAAARIGPIPKGQVRVTTLASVYLGKTTGAPLIRAAVASSIRGVVDPATDHATSTVQKHASRGPAGAVVLVGGILIAAIIALAIALVPWRRRRTPKSRAH